MAAASPPSKLKNLIEKREKMIERYGELSNMILKLDKKICKLIVNKHLTKVKEHHKLLTTAPIDKIPSTQSNKVLS